jgi:hypothetical protein
VDSADNYGTRMYGWVKPPETGEYTFWISGDDAQGLRLSRDTHAADATSVTAATWTEMKIPPASFAGMNMAKVETLIVGVGNRSNPAADGKRRIFVDDIRAVKSALAVEQP